MRPQSSSEPNFVLCPSKPTHCCLLSMRCAGENEAGPDRINSGAVILAGGRFAPLGWPALSPPGGQIFRRVEVGVRLEQTSGEFFLREDEFPDPKLILKSPDGRYSWRTFCCVEKARSSRRMCEALFPCRDERIARPPGGRTSGSTSVSRISILPELSGLTGLELMAMRLGPLSRSTNTCKEAEARVGSLACSAQVHPACSPKV